MADSNNDAETCNQNQDMDSKNEVEPWSPGLVQELLREQINTLDAKFDVLT